MACRKLCSLARSLPLASRASAHSTLQLHIPQTHPHDFTPLPFAHPRSSWNVAQMSFPLFCWQNQAHFSRPKSKVMSLSPPVEILHHFLCSLSSCCMLTYSHSTLPCELRQSPCLSHPYISGTWHTVGCSKCVQDKWMSQLPPQSLYCYNPGD